MKKTLAILLSLILAAGITTSCGSKKKDETKAPSQNTTQNTDQNKDQDVTESSDADTSAFTAQGMIDSIYAQKAPAFMFGTIPLDLSDAEAVKTYIGIDDVSRISDAAVSESMIGAQAYSLVVVRAAEGQDAKKLADDMKNGINNNKWVCVTADDVKVTSIGDLVCFCMIDTEYKDAFTAQDAMDAFKKVVNGDAEYIDNSIEEDITETEEGEENTEEVSDETTEENTDGDVTEENSPEDAGESSAEENKETEVKPESDKTEGTKAETPATKPEENKTEAPAKKPEANKNETPATKPAVKPETNKTETPAKKPETNKTETPVTKPAAKPETNKTETPAAKPQSTTSKYTLQGIIDSIYAQKAPAFMFGSIPVDLKDSFSYGTYLGIKDPSKISEAIVSESMIGAQAYSLVIARVAPGQNATAIANEMKAGIDNKKWICVTADDVKVTSYEDLVCFCMIDTEYKDVITASDITTAFTNVMTGKAKYKEGAAPNVPTVKEEPEIKEDPVKEEEPAKTEKPAESEKKEENFAETDEDTVVVGGSSLESIVNDMYAIKKPQFMIGTLPVDLSDSFACSSILGIKDSSKIAEAIYSEPMIGAQAYSLVIVRVAPGQNATAIANEMKAGIDPAKWVCVEADDIKTAVSGDLVCFCMISSDFASDYTAQDAIDSFKKVAK